MRHTKFFLVSTIFVGLNVLLLFWLKFLGILAWIWANDFTYISFLILFAYFLSILIISVESGSKKRKYNFSNYWFIAEQLPVLGLLGTVIGLLYMLQNNVQGVTITDTKSVINLMNNISLSMGTALITTATGLIASVLLKIQLVFFEHITSGK